MAKVAEEKVAVSNIARWFAEIWGTFVLVIGLIGAALFASGFNAETNGVGLLGVAFAVGLAVLAAAYSVGGISGAHLNPAITIGMAVANRFSWKDVPGYLVSQVIGALLATTVLFAIASDGPDGFLVNAQAAGFASNGYDAGSPEGFGLLAVIITEVVFTAILVWVVLGTTDKASLASFAPLAIGLTLTVIHIVTIPVSNTSVNPARSLATAVYGGALPMSQLWVFIVAPLAGGIIAGLTYGKMFGRKAA
ncbi:aquaporin Z [Aurantimicrobium minutum]|uniref:aquaporin Z n=1 Tax=Aurantimicrobium minutum TaxID=708131 RepID=UPI00247559F4|nr:aquaporin Z [Aurantimicrobium minutum]MDH6533211.1 aquaporin Z [Aurantimicrobium minutum]